MVTEVCILARQWIVLCGPCLFYHTECSTGTGNAYNNKFKFNLFLFFSSLQNFPLACNFNLMNFVDFCIAPETECWPWV